MFLPTKDGIICDFCGISYYNAFTYYSVDGILAKVVNNMRLSKTTKFSQDMCDSCYKKILDQVMSHVGSHRQAHIKCDLSSTYKTGTFDYWILNFDKVVVDKNDDDSIQIERQVMDLNVIKIDSLLKQIEEVKENHKQQGAWS